MNNMYTTYFLFRDKNYKRREELEVDGMLNTPFPEYWNICDLGNAGFLFLSSSVANALIGPYVLPDCRPMHTSLNPSYLGWPNDNNIFIELWSKLPIQIRMNKLHRFCKKENADVYVVKNDSTEYYELTNLKTTIRITSDPQKLEVLIRSFGWTTDEYLAQYRGDYFSSFDIMCSIQVATLLECGDIEDFFKYVEMPDSNKELCWAA